MTQSLGGLSTSSTSSPAFSSSSKYVGGEYRVVANTSGAASSTSVVIGFAAPGLAGGRATAAASIVASLLGSYRTGYSCVSILFVAFIVCSTWILY